MLIGDGCAQVESTGLGVASPAAPGPRGIRSVGWAMSRPAALRATLPAALVAATLAGCDALYSAGRHARVPYVPAADSVLARVRGVPGIDTAECDAPAREDDGRPVLRCSYRGGRHVEAFLMFREDAPGRVAYNQYVGYLRGPPPPGVVEASLPVMRVVEARLATLPGFEGLPAASVQECQNVRCP